MSGDLAVRRQSILWTWRSSNIYLILFARFSYLLPSIWWCSNVISQHNWLKKIHLSICILCAIMNMCIYVFVGVSVFCLLLVYMYIYEHLLLYVCVSLACTYSIFKLVYLYVHVYLSTHGKWICVCMLLCLSLRAHGCVFSQIWSDWMLLYSQYWFQYKWLSRKMELLTSLQQLNQKRQKNHFIHYWYQK